MQDKDNKKLQKSGHGAAAVTVNSDCEEVIVFGRKKRCDALVLRFGKYGSVLTSLMSGRIMFDTIKDVQVSAGVVFLCM